MPQFARCPHCGRVINEKQLAEIRQDAKDVELIAMDLVGQGYSHQAAVKMAIKMVEGSHGAGPQA